MLRLVVATRNPGKVAEIEEAVRGLGFDVRSLLDMAAPVEIAEDADTFAGNAVLKATAVSDAYGCRALADDSGLVVDALGGGPGVRSARYGGEGLDDRARCTLLLRELEQVPDALRTARFRCALAYREPGAAPVVFEGVFEGRISRAPAGDGGFGYDPVFVPEGGERTLAQLPLTEKKRISHRAKALSAFAAWLRSARR
jgi:XTP/dITP diphosphohydrolase